MKKIQFISMVLLLLSACTPQPTPTIFPTFTPSPTPQVMTPTPVPSATEGTPAAQPTLVTGTPTPVCKDTVAIVSWLQDDAPYDAVDATNNKPIPPNGHFTMTWTFQNMGSCIWDSSYKLAFKSGVFFTQTQTYPLVAEGQTVTPGQTVIVNISMVAPSKTGNYQAVWQFQNGRGKSLLPLNIVLKSDRGSSKPPAHPVSLAYTVTCTAGIGRIRLTWVDAANNEDGYRIYRGGMPLTEMPANSSAYNDVVPGAGNYEYAVVAFNVSGEAPANVSVNITSCK